MIRTVLENTYERVHFTFLKSNHQQQSQIEIEILTCIIHILLTYQSFKLYKRKKNEINILQYTDRTSSVNNLSKINQMKSLPFNTFHFIFIFNLSVFYYESQVTFFKSLYLCRSARLFISKLQRKKLLLIQTRFVKKYFRVYNLLGICFEF